MTVSCLEQKTQNFLFYQNPNIKSSLTRAYRKDQYGKGSQLKLYPVVT